MPITATHIAYYHLCHRKLWLFHHGIQMEHTSNLVSEGKLIDESSYDQRAQKWKQIQLEGIKVDYYDPRQKLIREVKKSSKREQAHVEQVKYYMYRFEKEGIPVKKGLLEYPRLRETQEVFLSDNDRKEIPSKLDRIQDIIDSDTCPSRINKPLCKRCAYYEFCYVDD